MGKIISIYDLRSDFNSFLKQNGHSDASANLICNNAFYVYYNESEYNLADLLFGEDDIIINYNKYLTERLGLLFNEIVAKEKASYYVDAINKLRFFCQENKIIALSSDNENDEKRTHILLNYCKNIKMTYSYKPVLIMKLIELCDEYGVVRTDSLAIAFKRYYDERRQQGKIIERKKSDLNDYLIETSSIVKILLNSPGKVLLKDGILLSADNNSFTLSGAIVSEIKYDRSHIIELCQEHLKRYYQRLETQLENHVEGSPQSKDEIMLGAILKSMYTQSDEKVINIYLFGIRYAFLIKEKNISPRRIIENAGLQASYLTELQKAIRLSKYVKEKDNV